ncbi:putative B3 domain-containing protein At5g58280 isoform X1 [Papaver somniferum]|nr:putative B3 domain-containing protein At5g58280 isoform X1 [Papaver somniferum]
MAQSNSYEEARKLRLEDNKRKFQMANSLSNVIRKKNNTAKNQVKSKRTPVNPDFVRRSSRPREQVTYTENLGLKNCKTSYIATRVVTYAERSDALNRAMSFQSGLLSGNPSFVKSVLHSHVSVLFVPVEIRNNHLPREAEVRIVFEDEDGSVYEAKYNGVYGLLTTGWKTFFMDHKLDNGDALVIEIIEPTRVKVHIFKVPNDVSEVKVDELKNTEESNSIKTVDVNKLPRLQGDEVRNPNKVEHCDTRITMLKN